jgi:glycine/D-amino acid oxidase-like deaminating enzyme
VAGVVVAFARAMGEFGIEAREMSLAEISELSPDMTVDALGGVYYPQDGHVTANPVQPCRVGAGRE